jgi:hypothetical protein
MVIRVYAVADIVEGNIELKGLIDRTEVTTLLVSLNPVTDPLTGHDWMMNFTIGEGPTARPIRMHMAPFVPKSYSPDAPLFLHSSENAKKNLILSLDLFSRSAFC